MRVFAFDRDKTVSVNQGPVPLEWVKRLATQGENEVWATGNQTLKSEAGIPGVSEAVERLQAQDVDTGIGNHVGMPARRERLRLLMKLFPSACEYIVVDDANLKDMEFEGWTYYSPEEFVEEYKDEFASRN